MTYREGLTVKSNALRAANDQKRFSQNKVKEIGDEIDALEAEK